MKRALQIALLLIVCTLPLSAQTVSVRSGEHSDFTRFTIRIPVGTEWSITLNDQRADLQVDLSEIRFDTAAVFSRVPRTRVRDLIQASPGAPLQFLLNCKCEVTGFLHGRDLLVVDVATASHSAQMTAAPRAPQGRTIYRFSTDNWTTESQLMQDEQVEPPLTLPAVHNSLPLDLRPSADALLHPDVARSARVTAMEQRLLAQLDRAAAQGLIDGAPAYRAENAHTEKARKETHPQISRANRPEKFGDMVNNISVKTSIDRDFAEVAEPLSAEGNTPNCIRSEQLALHDWATEEDFATQIGRARADMLGEFDQINPGVVMSLAKIYLHFGFGAEARQVLNLAEHPNAETAILMALANIIDVGETLPPNPFSGQQSCDSDASLWALYSEPQQLASANHAAVLQAVSRLSASLREYIGPEISRIYSKAGQGDRADAVLRSILRVVDTPGPAVKLAEAATADLRGDTTTAAQQRKEVVQSNSQKSPEALIELVQRQFEARRSLDPEMAGLVAAYATEFRHSDLGDKMRRTQVMALALMGNFSQASHLVENLTERKDVGADQSKVDLLTLLNERASDSDFLKFGLRLAEGTEADLPEELGNAMARRLLDLGFSRPAVRFLAHSDKTPASSERRLLRAEAAIGEDLPNEALIALLGVDGPEAASLRAEAMLLKKDHQHAAQLLLAANDPVNASRSFWLADDLNSAPIEPGQYYSNIVEAAASLIDTATPSDLMTPLARARALIAESSAARGTIEQLLQSAKVGAGPDKSAN